MNVGIVGLGLIGGSLAKAYAGKGHTVFGYDAVAEVTHFAMLSGAVQEELTEKTVCRCELLLLAVTPGAAVEYLRMHAHVFSSSLVVIDCCGTKREVCRAAFAIAEENGFTFLGGHPMAGTQYSGFKYSRANLFSGAPMVIVPPSFDNISLLARVKELLAPVGFGRISVTTAQKHDEMIAFTSQLAHVVSNAYIKSPTAREHKGFSAGSYKDLTRVAWLNPEMWTELILENRDCMLRELNTLLVNLTAYRDAVEESDSEKLRALFAEGKRIKEEVDGR